jgi:WD40 repeat protein
MNNLQFNKFNKLGNVTNNFMKGTFTMKTILQIRNFVITLTMAIICECSFAVADETAEFIELKGHTAAVTSASFSHDGKFVLTASRDKTARIWDAATGKELRKLAGHNGAITSASFSPDGKLIVTAADDDNYAGIWDATTGNVLHRLRHSEYHKADGYASFSPDGKLVVTAGGGDVMIWDVTTGKNLYKSNLTDSKNHVSFSPDRKYVIVKNWGEIVEIFDLTLTRRYVSNLKKKFKGYKDKFSSIESASFRPDGTLVVYITYYLHKSTWVNVDISTGKILHEWQKSDIRHTSRELSVSPDNKFIATGDTYILDIVTGNLLKRRKMLTNPFSPDSKFVAVVDYSWSRDGYALRIWDIVNDKVVRKFKGHKDEIYYASFSPDGKFVVTASADKTARIWNIEDIKQRFDLREKVRKEWIADGFVSLNDYLKKAGFEEYDIRYGRVGNNPFYRYGTKDLQSKFEKTDDFDQLAIKKEIEAKQNEIKSKKFFIELPYRPGNTNVNDTVSSVSIDIPLGCSVNKIKNASVPDSDGYYQYQCELSGKTIKCSLKEKQGFSYVLVTGETELIKNLVRQHENYEIIVKLENLLAEGDRAENKTIFADILDVQVVEK